MVTYQESQPSYLSIFHHSPNYRINCRILAQVVLQPYLCPIRHPPLVSLFPFPPCPDAKRLPRVTLECFPLRIHRPSSVVPSHHHFRILPTDKYNQFFNSYIFALVRISTFSLPYPTLPCPPSYQVPLACRCDTVNNRLPSVRNSNPGYLPTPQVRARGRIHAVSVTEGVIQHLFWRDRSYSRCRIPIDLLAGRQHTHNKSAEGETYQESLKHHFNHSILSEPPALPPRLRNSAYLEGNSHPTISFSLFPKFCSDRRETISGQECGW